MYVPVHQLTTASDACCCFSCRIRVVYAGAYASVESSVCACNAQRQHLSPKA